MAGGLAHHHAAAEGPQAVKRASAFKIGKHGRASRTEPNVGSLRPDQQGFMHHFSSEASEVTNLLDDSKMEELRKAEAKASKRAMDWARAGAQREGFSEIAWREGLYNFPIPLWYRAAAIWCRHLLRTALFEALINGTILLLQFVLFVTICMEPGGGRPASFETRGDASTHQSAVIFGVGSRILQQTAIHDAYRGRQPPSARQRRVRCLPQMDAARPGVAVRLHAKRAARTARTRRRGDRRHESRLGVSAPNPRVARCARRGKGCMRARAPLSSGVRT